VHFCHFKKKILQEKAVEATKQKEGKRKKPKPEEQEGTSISSFADGGKIN
jgi:hypothetical protein